jgi:hypothetical protein
LVQVACDRNVLHGDGLPPHVPPTPASFGVQVQPAAVHCAELLTFALVYVAQPLGVPVQAPVVKVQPWHSEPPHNDVGHDAHVE